ncbi:hypothetical protein SAMN02745704_01346 [Paucidesulfovibrio gracilis DSM 16080]|uniref:Lipoprotein n=1 Tax=Paucidesulfovibrio gracilis DSM 16080 TaxID=1121449 RepID=A0A1T4WU51_9BACT|nr:hypothetical protein [Paucidesulfovibrio gracilis]SKA80395.1 hypothetical protein SAMN02745704_01346 [Paucidesulfovibrio gracilis DSM 16080]
MRRTVVALSMLFLCLGLLPSAVYADEVRIFQPREEGMSPNEMRQQALHLSFEEAVFQAALKLLPQPPSEERATLLRERLAKDVEPFVLGYKELASSPTPEGLNMLADVDVDRRGLRAELESLGLFQTIGGPLAARVVADPTLTGEDLERLRSLRILTGIAPSAVTLPELRLGREPDGPVRGVLHSSTGNWSALDPDLETVWFHLWERYFQSSAVAHRGLRTEVLSVSGWFTPDGAHEFDNMLQGWESLLREARLVDMDMAPEGVSARWEIAVADRAALVTRLEEYLPARGLGYTLSNSDQ